MLTRTRSRRRADGLRQLLRPHALDGLVSLHPVHLRYLTGFSGTAGAVVVTGDAVLLLVDARYTEQAASEAPHAIVMRAEPCLDEAAVARAVRQAGVRTLAFEADLLSYAAYLGLERALPGVHLVPSVGLVARLREVKDSTELAAQRQAAAITSQVVTAVLAGLTSGITEREVAWDIDGRFRRCGAGNAFPTLVAFGERTALVHPTPTERRLAPGDWVLIDAGAQWEGYCADMTRSAVFGPAEAAQQALWASVRAALAAGLAAVRPGVLSSAVDAACREALGAPLVHPAGHGVGLEIHESPRLAPDGDEPLAAGMVVTVEPGRYLPGFGGVRLEELVLVTRDGAEVLTRAPLTLHTCPLVL